MLVSVIVPVYKAEKWLHRCVDSILAQTMEDFELLLIDDGSPDRSGEICDEYAAKDSRVRVFHKDNGGVSSARNLGLDNAQGEWISFVDADDWVEVDYLAGLTEHLDADFITGGMRETTGNIYKLDDELFSKKGVGLFLKEHNGDTFIRSTWGKLIRKSIIDYNQIRFDKKIRWGEDTVFNKCCLLNSKSVRLVGKSQYNYYIPGDIVNRNKYSLSFGELEYTLDSIALINKKLGIAPDICQVEYKVAFFQMLKLEEIGRVGFNRYYELCEKYYCDLTKSKFYSDVFISPVIKGIAEIKDLYLYEALSIKTFFYSLNLLFSPIPWLVNFKFKDFYLWYFFVKCGWWRVFDFSMKLYLKLKR